MAIDRTGIQNLAITLIGGKTITSDTDSAKAARFAESLFEISAKGMLTLPINWNFASTYAKLSALAAPTIGKYSYRYLVPSNCLRVIANIDVSDTAMYEFGEENYIDSQNRAVRALLTNESTCYIKYVYDLSSDVDVAKWPAWFSRIVALDLALIMCEPLKQDKLKQSQLYLMMFDPANGWMHKAIVANAMSGAEYNQSGNIDEEGNNDVLEASTKSIIEKRYIINR